MTHLLIAVCFAVGSSLLHAQSTSGITHLQYDQIRNSYNATVNDDGRDRFAVAWSERDSKGGRIYSALLDRFQRVDPVVFAVSEPPTGCTDVRPSITHLSGDAWLIIWQRICSGRQWILGRVIENGNAKEEFTINDTTLSKYAATPFTRKNEEGEVLIVWQENRGSNTDVFAALFNRENGTMEAQRVNDDEGKWMQGSPVLSSGGRENLLVFWTDNRVDGYWKLYSRLWNDGPVGMNVLVDSAQRKAMTIVPSCYMKSADTAVFTWKDYREGHSNIYSRTADIPCSDFSPARRINDDKGKRWQRLAVIDGDARGNYVICWEDYRNTEINQRGDTYLQPFLCSSAVEGKNVRVNDRSDRIARKIPQIAMNRRGDYLVLWHQGERGQFIIMGQWFQFPAERVGDNFCVSCELKAGYGRYGKGGGQYGKGGGRYGKGGGE